MALPIQLSFHQMERSDALERAIAHRTERLGRYRPAITSVHISVTRERRQGEQEPQFNVRLDLYIKERSFAISQRGEHDALVAARAAFDAAERVLEEELDTARGFVKLF